MDKACKSNALFLTKSGKRVSNTLVTYPEDGNSSGKPEVMPDSLARVNLARGFRMDLGPISLLVR